MLDRLARTRLVLVNRVGLDRKDATRGTYALETVIEFAPSQRDDSEECPHIGPIERQDAGRVAQFKSAQSHDLASAKFPSYIWRNASSRQVLIARVASEAEEDGVSTSRLALSVNTGKPREPRGRMASPTSSSERRLIGTPVNSSAVVKIAASKSERPMNTVFAGSRGVRVRERRASGL